MSRNKHKADELPAAVALQPVVAPPAPPAQPDAGKATWRFKLGAPWPIVDIAIDGVVGDEAAARTELLRQLEASIVSASKHAAPVLKQLETVEHGLAKFTDGSTLPLPEGALVTPKVLELNPETNDERLVDANGRPPTGWHVQLPGHARVLAWRKKFGWTRVRQEIEMLRCDQERALRQAKPKLFDDPIPAGMMR